MQVFTIPFMEASAFIVMRQIAATVAQMHQRNIIHSDLKEGNILVGFEKANQDNRIAGCLPISFKIADLGIAKDLSEESLS